MTWNRILIADENPAIRQILLELLQEDSEVVAVVEEAPIAALPAPSALKQKAAAAAVAIALAMEEDATAEMAAPLPAAYIAQPSAWQAVMRAAQLNQRSNHFTRKPRGSAR